MTNNTGNLSDLKTYKGTNKITFGDGSFLNITHNGNKTKSGLKIKETLVVPKIKKNLLFVSKLAKDNCCTIEFDGSNFIVKYKNSGIQISKGTRKEGLYTLKDNIYALTAPQTGGRQIAFDMLD